VEPFASGLRQAPEVLGIVQLAVDAQVLRVTAETIPSRRWQIERELRELITTRLTDRGVTAASGPLATPSPAPPKP